MQLTNLTNIAARFCALSTESSRILHRKVGFLSVLANVFRYAAEAMDVGRLFPF